MLKYGSVPDTCCSAMCNLNNMASEYNYMNVCRSGHTLHMRIGSDIVWHWKYYSIKWIYRNL